jgi:phage terminase large subunit
MILNNIELDDLDPLYRAYEPKMKNGCDFGFSSDECAVIRCAIRPEDGAVLVFDVPVYDRGMTNDILAERIKRDIKSAIITCDSAEPKSIQELVNCNVSAIGARKGKDSVRHGIQWLQQRKIVLNRSRCQHLFNELSQWQWKKDKYGETLPEPVDANNHAIDALRYALEDEIIGAGAQLY